MWISTSPLEETTVEIAPDLLIDEPPPEAVPPLETLLQLPFIWSK
jgi:hypothetical protein